MSLEKFYSQYPDMKPPEDPHELVRWCFRRAIDEAGRLSNRRRNYKRDYIRQLLGISSLKQLSDDEAVYLYFEAENDPDIWEDAVFAFRYHVSKDLVIPKPLAFFASMALKDGPPRRKGRHKGDQSERNKCIHMAALHLRGIHAGAVHSIICDVLTEMGESITPDAVRKVIENHSVADKYDLALTRNAFQLASEVLAERDKT